MSNEIKCETCDFWKDYTDRVTACVKGTTGNFVRNRIELRRCKYTPPPSQEFTPVYVDKDYSCGQWREKREQ